MASIHIQGLHDRIALLGYELGEWASTFAANVQAIGTDFAHVQEHLEAKARESALAMCSQAAVNDKRSKELVDEALREAQELGIDWHAPLVRLIRAEVFRAR